MLRTFLAAFAFLIVDLALAPTAAGQCSHWTTGFESPGFDGAINASIVFDDGSGPALYVGGAFSHVRRVPALGVARFDGVAWTQVGAGIDGNIHAFTVFDDGSGPKLAAGGDFRTGTTVAGRVALWSGTQWNVLGANLPPTQNQSQSVLALAVYDDGSGPKLYAGGTFEAGVRRFDGQAWQVVAGGLFAGLSDARVDSFAVFDDGLGGGAALYVGGFFSSTGSSWGPDIGPNITRTHGSSFEDAGTASGLSVGIGALCVFDDGAGAALYAGGSFFDGSSTFHVGRWSGVTWLPLSSDVDGSVTQLSGFSASTGVPPGLWVGGTFTHAGGVAALGLARFFGGSWDAPGGTHLFSYPITLAAFDDGAGHGRRVFAGSPERTVERLDVAGWTLLGGDGANDEVKSLAVLHGPGSAQEMWATGNFSVIGGVSTHGLARFDGSSWHGEAAPAQVIVAAVATLDMGSGEELYLTGHYPGIGPSPINLWKRAGSTWIALPLVPTWNGREPYALAVFDAGNGNHLYAGGEFGLWRLDGGAWTSVIGQTNYAIEALTVFDDGSGRALFLGGEFQTIGGVAYRSIARWNGQTLDDLGGGASAQAYLFGLQVWNDGTGPALYATGNFHSMGGVAADGIAKWNGHAWSAVGGGLQGSFALGNKMCVHDDGSGVGPELVVSGLFTGAGGQPAGHIARWNGSAWRTMDGGVTVHNTQNTSVPEYAIPLAVFDGGDGHGQELYTGGNFLQAGTFDSSFLARWTSCGGDAQTFCFGDGSGAACPCGNASAIGTQSGCLDSFGVGATLRAHGSASVSADTLVLEGGSLAGTIALYFQGQGAANGGAGVAFGDGLRCASGPYVRLGMKLNTGGASAYPGANDPSISAKGNVMSPGTRTYQVRYRNSAAFCTSDTFNLTNGVSVAWGN